MATLDISAATTTDLDTSVDEFSVAAKPLDTVEGETYWYFKNAKTNFGYLKTIPEYKAALKSLAIYVVGKGYELENLEDVPILENIRGNGKDTIISILEGMIIVKKAIGDAFAQIIRNDKAGTLVNLKPISPERVRIVYSPNGLIKRYDIRKNSGKWQALEKENMFHLINDRIADEVHGTATTDTCKWVIDARHEALTDERKIKHRQLGLGILYVDTDNPTKLAEIKEQYADAINKNELLVLPMGTAEIKDSGVNPKDRLAWIQYLENFMYQAVEVPRVIATSENYTEAASKVGYLTFEPVYTNEQTLLEADMWNQLGIKITFKRPASLGGTIQEDEAKNTGQTGFQPKETEATMERE